MAWNEPGGNNNKDPWGNNNRGSGGDGPPDLDEAIKAFQKKISGIFGGGKGGSSGNKSPSLGKLPIGVLIAVIVAIYGFAGFYQVNEQQRAVVLRLGVYNMTKGPGLRWNPPLIDQVTKENVTRKRTETVEGTMLTEDLNMVYITLSVQYTINDAKDFVLNVRDPEKSLEQATESALRHVVGSNVMHEVLTEGREAAAVNVQSRLQQYLDDYRTGILVDKVNVQESAPPDQVQASFDDVNRAREDEERAKNEAQTYANDILPRARGAAQRTIEEANAYRDQVIARAEGEANRFEKLLTEYAKAPEVTRERLYLDAIQDVMSNTAKVMVDIEGGNNMMYLPLDKILENRPAPAFTNQGGASSDLVNEIERRVLERMRRDAQNTRTTRSGR